MTVKIYPPKNGGYVTLDVEFQDGRLLSSMFDDCDVAVIPRAKAVVRDDIRLSVGIDKDNDVAVSRSICGCSDAIIAEAVKRSMKEITDRANRGGLYGCAIGRRI